MWTRWWGIGSRRDGPETVETMLWRLCSWLDAAKAFAASPLNEQRRCACARKPPIGLRFSDSGLFSEHPRGRIERKARDATEGSSFPRLASRTRLLRSRNRYAVFFRSLFVLFLLFYTQVSIFRSVTILDERKCIFLLTRLTLFWRFPRVFHRSPASVSIQYVQGKFNQFLNFIVKTGKKTLQIWKIEHITGVAFTVQNLIASFSNGKATGSRIGELLRTVFRELFSSVGKTEQAGAVGADDLLCEIENEAIGVAREIHKVFQSIYLRSYIVTPSDSSFWINANLGAYIRQKRMQMTRRLCKKLGVCHDTEDLVQTEKSIRYF